MKGATTIFVLNLAMIATYGLQYFKDSNGKYGFKDSAGNIIIAAKYDDVHDFSEGLAAVRIGYNWGFIDELGKEVIPLGYFITGSFSDGLALVVERQGVEKNKSRAVSMSQNLKYGFINKGGEGVIPIQYDDARSFVSGVASVRLDKRWLKIDKTGKEVK